MKTTITVYAFVSDVHNAGTDCTIFSTDGALDAHLKSIMEDDINDAVKRHRPEDDWTEYDGGACGVLRLISEGNIAAAWCNWCCHCQDDRDSFSIYKKEIEIDVTVTLC